MAQKFYFYIDYGSGDTLIDPQNIQCKLSLTRGVLNDFIVRKSLEGSFELVESEYDSAHTFFITNGNYKAGLKIYENGDSGSGELQFEGSVRTKGEWDNAEKKVTFDSFEMNDQYTDLLAVINNKFKTVQLAQEDSYTRFAAQGQDPNANQLYRITWDGTNFTIAAGTPTTSANLGRCDSDISAGGDVTVYDNVTGNLITYSIVSQWTQQRSRAGGISYGHNNVAVVGLPGATNKVYLIGDGDSATLEEYSYSGASSLNSTGSWFIGDIKHPSACYTGGRIALVDEQTKTLRELSVTGFEKPGITLGDIIKPAICSIDTSTETIAFVDAWQRKLQTYQYTGGNFVPVGNALSISSLTAPDICRGNAINTIILHDTVVGVLRYYSFDGTNWSQTGNTLNIGGGYQSTVSNTGTNIMLAISDTSTFIGSVMSSSWSNIRSLLDLNNIGGTSIGEYSIDSSGTGATIDPQKLILGDMADISDNKLDAGNGNKYQESLSDALGFYQMFENYWYVEDGDGVTYHKIKFTQPSLFSTVGTDINVSSLDAATELNQRIYKDEFTIDQEELITNNADGTDFLGGKIEYNRETPINKEVVYPFTTDIQNITNIIKGIDSKEINSAGLIAWYRDTITGFAGNVGITLSDTGLVSGNDIKNVFLSQSQIYNDFWNDYRYALDDIDINGSPIATPDTCKNIIAYPDINFAEGDVGLSQFPSDIASIIWGGSTPKSLIMKLSIDLQTWVYTASSRRHDI